MVECKQDILEIAMDTKNKNKAKIQHQMQSKTDMVVIENICEIRFNEMKKLIYL